MESVNHEEKMDGAWVDDAPSTSKDSMSGKDQNPSPTRTELLTTGSDRTQSGRAVNSARGIAPRPSSKSKSNAGTPDKNGTQTGDAIFGVVMGPVIPLSEKRTASMPVTPFLESSLGSPGPSSIHQSSSKASVTTESGSVEMKNIARSSSVPLNKLPLPPSRKPAGPSTGVTVLLKSITSRTTVGTSGDDNTATKDSEPIAIQTDVEKGEKDHVKDGDEEIPEEEAVCRICFEELSDKHGETFKMECSCRGEMALAHKDCALKWFSIKGNRTCDVCGLEVCNLPVTVVRQGNQPSAVTRPANQILETHTRVWQDVPVLVMLSMLVYFCFLEQLLVGQMGSGALAISLPFSCVLGLLAAITASNLVEKRYVWLYATCQLALVICFAHIFFDVVHVESVLSILLSAFVGFGIAMVTSTLIIEYGNWKRRTAARVQREREAAGSATTVQAPEPNLRAQPAGDPQHDHVVLQMEGGGLASLWLQPGDNRQAQPSLPAH